MASLGELLAADGFARGERRKRQQCPSSPPPPRAGSVVSCIRNRNGRRSPSPSISRSLVDDIVTSSSSSNNSTSFRAEEDSRKSGSEEIEEVFGELDHSSSYKYTNELYEDDQEASNEAPMKAVVSILTGYIARFLDDGRFRTSIHRRCASCLGPDGPEPVGILEEAIAAVERAAEEGGAGTSTSTSSSVRDLKKASLRLSLVAGLGSPELKGEYTSGVPNSRLAACARLYLAVVYEVKNKGEVSAKHLLQVFSDCPNEARTVLLPELWDRLFLGHLSDLTDWYLEEVEAVGRRRGGDREKKLALLEEVYNSSLDMGTGQFAAYYKEWLVAGEEPPRTPSVPVPDSIPFHGRNESPGPGSAGGYHATVSRELYESVFGSTSGKMERHDRAFEEWKSEEEEEEEEEENENIVGEEKQSLCSPDQLSSSEDDEWGGRQYKARDRRVQLMPTFSARVRTSLLPPWGIV